MKLIKMDQLQGEINQKGVLMKTLVAHQNATVRNLILQPEQTIPPHEVPVNVFFYIVSGKGSIMIGPDKLAVEETDIVVCPPNTPMSVYADKGQALSFLNVKTPSLS